MIKGHSRARMRLKKKASIIGFRDLNVHDMIPKKKREKYIEQVMTS